MAPAGRVPTLLRVTFVSQRPLTDSDAERISFRDKIRFVSLQVEAARATLHATSTEGHQDNFYRSVTYTYSDTVHGLFSNCLYHVSYCTLSVGVFNRIQPI